MIVVGSACSGLGVFFGFGAGIGKPFFFFPPLGFPPLVSAGASEVALPLSPSSSSLSEEAAEAEVSPSSSSLLGKSFPPFFPFPEPLDPTGFGLPLEDFFEAGGGGAGFFLEGAGFGAGLPPFFPFARGPELDFLVGFPMNKSVSPDSCC
jgi:hypothetical protein